MLTQAVLCFEFMVVFICFRITCLIILTEVDGFVRIGLLLFTWVGCVLIYLGFGIQYFGGAEGVLVSFGFKFGVANGWELCFCLGLLWMVSC